MQLLGLWYVRPDAEHLPHADVHQLVIHDEGTQQGNYTKYDSRDCESDLAVLSVN